MELAARFGRNLARCRKETGLSQEELGVRASMHRTAVGELERGERIARIDTLVKLAGALSVPPADLLEGLVWKPGEMLQGQFTVSDGDEEAGSGSD